MDYSQISISDICLGCGKWSDNVRVLEGDLYYCESCAREKEIHDYGNHLPLQCERCRWHKYDVRLYDEKDSRGLPEDADYGYYCSDCIKIMNDAWWKIEKEAYLPEYEDDDWI